MKNLLLLLCAVLVISAYAQEAKPLPVKVAIKMAETVIAETALEKGQKPRRYNYWMYQNYMITEGIKAMGEACPRVRPCRGRAATASSPRRAGRSAAASSTARTTEASDTMLRME